MPTDVHVAELNDGCNCLSLIDLGLTTTLLLSGSSDHRYCSASSFSASS